MPIAGFDHVALPSANPEELLGFYKALGFTINREAEWRAGEAPTFSMAIGDHKINVHPPGYTAELRGQHAVPGCGDLCFVWEGAIGDLRAVLDEAGIAVLKGPVERIGGRAGGTARGSSIYVRDPDGNLVEFLCYEHDPGAR